MTVTDDYVSVHIESTDSDKHGVPNYLVHCLPEGGNFRDTDAYETYEASWLKVNGIGFGTSGCEFSEYGKMIEVTQDASGGSLNIQLPE